MRFGRGRKERGWERETVECLPDRTSDEPAGWGVLEVGQMLERSTRVPECEPGASGQGSRDGCQCSGQAGSISAVTTSFPLSYLPYDTPNHSRRFEDGAARQEKPEADTPLSGVKRAAKMCVTIPTTSPVSIEISGPPLDPCEIVMSATSRCCPLLIEMLGLTVWAVPANGPCDQQRGCCCRRLSGGMTMGQD